MKIHLKITKVRESEFQGRDGETVKYYWITGERDDGVAIEFGSMRDDYQIGEDGDVELTITEATNSKGATIKKYKEYGNK